MKFISVFLLLMSFSATVFGNVSAALKQRLPLHKEFMEFGKVIAGSGKTESLATLIQTKKIDVLLEELNAKIAAAETVDIVEIRDEKLAHELLDWLIVQVRIISDMRVRTLTYGKAEGRHNEHGMRLSSQINALIDNLIAKFVPASTAFTNLPFIQQETVLKETLTYPYQPEDFLFSNGSNSDRLAHQFKLNVLKLVLYENLSNDYKMERLRVVFNLLTVDLREVMPRATSLTTNEYASAWHNRAKGYPNQEYLGAAEVVIAGFPQIVEGVKQLNAEEIKQLYVVTDLTDIVNTDGEARIADPIEKHVMHDLTPEGANLLRRLSIFGLTENKKALQELASQIEEMQAAKQ